MSNPITSKNVIISSSTIHAINAEIEGTKKNKFEVLLAVPIFIKYIKIVNAPKEIKIICQLIDIIKLKLKKIKEFSKKNIIKKKKMLAPIA